MKEKIRSIFLILTGIIFIHEGITNKLLFFTGLFLITLAVFELLKRYVTLFRLIYGIFVVMMWVTLFTQPKYVINPLIDYIVTISFTILAILLTYYAPKEWEKTQKLKQNN